MQPFNINVTDGPKTCNRGEDWGSYKGVVNCNTCRLPGLRITKESIWGFFEGRTPEDRLGLPLERAQVVGSLNPPSPTLLEFLLQRAGCAYGKMVPSSCQITMQSLRCVSASYLEHPLQSAQGQKHI